MKTRLLEMIGAPLSRPWWRERWHELRDSWSYSFALSTLFHVAVIIGVGSMWFFANHDSGISSLDTRWTDTVETPVLEDAVETPERARERVQATLQQRGAGESSLRFVGEGVQRYRDEFRSPLEEFLYSTEILEGPEARGFAVAEVGLERFGQQGPADPIYLAPVYLRESEAERKRKQNS